MSHEGRGGAQEVPRVIGRRQTWSPRWVGRGRVRLGTMRGNVPLRVRAKGGGGGRERRKVRATQVDEVEGKVR